MRYEVSLERLRNGYIRAFDRGSGLSGLWHADGTPRHGDLTSGRIAWHIGMAVRAMDIAGTTYSAKTWELAS